MNYFTSLITRRRSTRQYMPNKSLSSFDIKQIMTAALMAPTSKNSRPWHFILVENKQSLKELSACKPSGASFISNSALAIVVISDPQQSEAPIEDASIAATYLQLKAEDLDLGSCWIHVRERKTKDGNNAEQYVRSILNIPNSFYVECIISIGYKDKENNPQNEKKLLWEKIHKETW